MSTLEVNTIDSVSGTSNLTIGSSNSSQITLKSGATLTNFPANAPAFSARMSSAQSITSGTYTKVDYDTEFFDTDSAYDHSTNQRFTVPSGKAGKYIITALLNIYSSSALDAGSNYIRVNGTTVQTGYMDVGGNHDYHLSITCSTIKDLSVGDYVEHWGLVNGEPAGTYKFYSDSNILRSFSLYRIGS